MNGANSEETYKAAAYIFQTISGFKDADILAEDCFAKAENSADEHSIATEKNAKKHKKIISIVTVIAIVCVVFTKAPEHFDWCLWPAPTPRKNVIWRSKADEDERTNGSEKSVYENIPIDTATLVIRRMTSNFCSGEKIDLLIDGEIICDMDENQESEFNIYVGTHTIGIIKTINGEKILTEFDIVIDDNDTYAFEYMLANGGKIINVNA